MYCVAHGTPGGSQKPLFVKESLRLNWNFCRGEGPNLIKVCSDKGGVWIFSEITHGEPN